MWAELACLGSYQQLPFLQGAIFRGGSCKWPFLEDLMRNVCYLLHDDVKSAIADITDVVQNRSTAS